GIIYHGSAQNFRAQLIATSDSVDLALLRVLVRGGVPVVRGLAETGRTGDPVAIAGFPLGLDSTLTGDWRRTGVAAAIGTGTIVGADPGLLTLDGYGAGGSSGSPLFDAAGLVAGVLFGGDPASGGRVVYAVPARHIGELLRKAGVR
ncbi:MAG: trypsin-like peptidase domain-containing protein, partial [Gemmatimonadales bacterium]|nr:trypsin-like peptidase domain-containing protein [Gemmatimonadales bacterium]